MRTCVFYHLELLNKTMVFIFNQSSFKCQWQHGNCDRPAGMSGPVDQKLMLASVGQKPQWVHILEGDDASSS